tara:strand:- start:12485 stop:14356 length:1872 start_codon:yes stop_codon:yes gene_type:complete
MVAVLAPVMLVFAVLITVISMELKTELPAQQKLMLQKELSARSSEVTRWLDGYKNWIWSLAQTRELTSMEASDVRQWLASHTLKNEAVNALIYIRPDGSAVSDAPDSSFDLSARAYYKEVMAHGEPVLSEPVKSKAGGMPVSVIAVPIKEGNRITGMVAAAITMEKLSEIANQLSTNRGDYGWIVDKTGGIIGYPDQEAILKANITDPVNASMAAAGRVALQKKTGSGTYTRDGETFFILYNPIKSTPGWIMGTSVPMDTFTHTTNSLLFKVTLLMASALIILAIILIVISGRMVKPLKKMVSMLQGIAEGEGDLTQRLPVDGKDEISQLADGFNRFTDRIHQLMIQVADITGLLNGSATSLQKGGNEMRDAVNQQQSEVDQIAAAMNEMESTVREVAAHAQTASNAAQEGNIQVQEGSMRVGRVREVIAEQAQMIRTSAEEVSALQESGEQIGQVMTVIRAIAEQTNLLALNAAIEAARAGDAGRGFAVVSDEVRQLAGRTHESTRQIEETVGALQERITRAVDAMQASSDRSSQSVTEAQAADEALQAIRDAIGNIEGMNLQIAAATEEQSATAAELNRNLGVIVEVSNTTLQQTSSAAATIQDLFAQAESLHGCVGRFKL